MSEDIIIKMLQTNLFTAKHLLPILASHLQLKALNHKDFSKISIVVAGEIKENLTKLILISNKKIQKKYFNKFTKVFKINFKNNERTYEYFIDTYENIKEKLLLEDKVYNKVCYIHFHGGSAIVI